MKKVSIDVWIQLFGMLSVVAGLIFVGLQMTQTQRIALASQQQARAAILNDMVLGLTEANVDFQSVFWERNFQNNRSTEEVAYRNQIHIAWSLHENDFYQYTQGLMDEATWTAKLEGITLIYGYCDVREIYNRRAPIFSAPFRAIIESLPDECANSNVTTNIAGIDFGDNTSQWANDGECDDPRFEGVGMATTPIDDDLLSDATDCSEAYQDGSIALIRDFSLNSN